MYGFHGSLVCTGGPVCTAHNCTRQLAGTGSLLRGRAWATGPSILTQASLACITSHTSFSSSILHILEIHYIFLLVFRESHWIYWQTKMHKYQISTIHIYCECARLFPVLYLNCCAHYLGKELGISPFFFNRLEKSGIHSKQKTP